MAVIDIREAWAMAEQTVYDKLLEATGADDGDGAFLGAEGPGNSWSLYVGGGAAEGARNQCYTTLNLSARIVGRYYERADCIAWTGAIMGMLKDTSNVNAISGTNVVWFRPLEWPGEPAETEDANGDRVFVQVWNMELVARSDNTYT